MMHLWVLVQLLIQNAYYQQFQGPSVSHKYEITTGCDVFFTLYAGRLRVLSAAKCHILCATEMTRIVWILVFVGVIAGATAFMKVHPRNLGWLFGVDGKSDVKKSERSLCETPECVALAKIMTESMNPDVDPCENFYEFACGNWEKHNPLPEGKEAWGPLYKANAVVEQRLLDILQEKSKPEDLLGLKLSRRAFNACMDTDEVERIGLGPLITSLWRIGGWPLIMEDDEWDDELYTWQYVDDYYARLIGLNSLHDVKVDVPWNWDTNATYLTISTPSIPYKMYRLVSSDEVTPPDYKEDEGKDGSQEHGSEERPEDDDHSEEDDEEDEYDEEDDEDNEIPQDKRIIKRINKGLGRKMKKHSNAKLSDKKHVIKKRARRSATRSNSHYKSNHKQRKADNRRIVHNKRTINRPSHHSKMPARHHLKTHSGKSKGDEKLNRYIYIDDEDTEDKNFDNDPGNSGNYENYDDDNENSGSGSGDVDDDSEQDDEEGSGDDEDAEEKRRRWKEEERAEIEKLKKIYKEYMFNVTMTLIEARNVEIPTERIRKDLDDVLEFQLNILRAMFQDYDVSNSTLEGLQKKYDDLGSTTMDAQINWANKVRNLLATAGMEIDSDAMIVIPSDEYLKGLRNLLDKTPRRTIVNYIHWNFIRLTIKGTTERMRELYFGWNTYEQESDKRSMQCIEELEMKYYLGYEYVKRYFSDDWLKTASDMVDDIQKEVEHQIEESTWMDDATREFILSKLVFMDKLIGYPPVYRNYTAMKTHFKGLTISSSHFENMLGVMRHLKRVNLKSLYDDGNPTEKYYIDPLVVNAFYMPSQNTFEITAADFQSPFYSPKQPWYTNFGIIGFIMAHEVNHGFDTMGRFFDRHGEYSTWLSAMADKAYEKRAKCFKDQYTKYSVVENRTANIPIEDYGDQTSGENIADTMGLQAVFGAYERRQRNCEVPDPMLPGLENFTNNQMFFLSAATVWCTVYDMDKIESRILRDSHSLAPLRVIGSLSNSEDFAKAYGCPAGSPMNPEKKCSIWK